jgi:hypothetical protein
MVSPNPFEMEILIYTLIAFLLGAGIVIAFVWACFLGAGEVISEIIERWFEGR